MKKLQVTIRTKHPEALVRGWFVGLGLGGSIILVLVAFAAVVADSPAFPTLRDYQHANPPMLAVWSCIALYLLNPPVLLVSAIIAALTNSLLLQVVVGIPVAVWWWRRLAGIVRVTAPTGAG